MTAPAHKPTCPLCDSAKASIDPVDRRHAFVSDCPVCGRFLFTPESLHALNASLKFERYLLSALTRRATIEGNRLEILAGNLGDLVANAPRPNTPHDVLEPLLLAIHASTPSDLTGYARIPYSDYPLYIVPSADTLGEYLKLLEKLGLIEFEPYQDDGDVFWVRLTLSGWDRVEELRRGGKASKRAFVAMSFHADLDAVWTEGLEPALKEAGWDPIRMDRVEHNGRIDDRIMAEIRRAGLVVADFTGNRQGVYFEAGFALGLGLPVVWTVAKRDLDQVHFDTRQYNHIDWVDIPDLRKRLTDR